MSGQEEPPKKPEMITTILFLERLSPPIDYTRLTERIGGAIGLDPAQLDGQKLDAHMVLSANGDLIFGLNMDFPYPDPPHDAANFAYWWPNALSDIARSKSHFIVSCSWQNHSRLEAHMRQLILVRELVEQLPVIGVLWGSCLTQTDLFKSEFTNTQEDGLPFSLWVLIQYSKQPNGNILISTLGMRDFGAMEIETESSLALDQTFDLVRNIGSYILGNNPPIKDGDTVGLSEEQKVRVRHTRSFRSGDNTPVYWLELTEQPTVRKPQGIFSKLFGSSTKH
jgi:Domain of unknown function (DUF4261)